MSKQHYILNRITEGTENFFDFLINRMPTKKAIEHTAEFEPISSLLSPYNYGFSLDGRHNTTLKDAYKNSLIVGASGAGKSSSIVAGTLHSISRGKSSAVVMDPSGELYSLFSGYLTSIGYKIYRIDFNSAQTDAFNGLEFCTTKQQVQQFSHIIIANSNVESQGDKFWSIASEMALTIILEYLCFHAPKEVAHLGSALAIVERLLYDSAGVDVLFAKVTDAELLSAYMAMISQGEKLNQNILATLKAALKMFSISSVVRATSVNTIPFSDFRKEPSILFNCTPVPVLKFFAPINALLFTHIFNEILSQVPGDGALPIFNILDEMLAYKLDILPTVLAQIRKYKASCMCIIQDTEMLKSVYSAADAHSIVTNTYSKVYLPPQPLSTCRELSEMLGRHSYKDEHDHTQIRRLMEVEEIRRMEDTLFLIGAKASRGKLYPYYESSILRKLTSMPPMPFPNKLPAGMPPTIHFG